MRLFPAALRCAQLYGRDLADVNVAGGMPFPSGDRRNYSTGPRSPAFIVSGRVAVCDIVTRR